MLPFQYYDAPGHYDLSVGEEAVAEKSELGLRVTVALVVALIGLILLLVSLAMPNPLGQPVGPGYVPALLGACTLIFSSWDTFLAIREWRRRSASSASTEGVRVRLAAFWNAESNWLKLTVLLAFSIYVWGLLGSFAGMAVASFSLIWVDGALGLKKGAIYAVTLSLSMWFLFEKVFGSSLG
jgi:hypothetical protein